MSKHPTRRREDPVTAPGRARMRQQASMRGLSRQGISRRSCECDKLCADQEPSRAHCHVCDRITETSLIALSSGHIGNACADCRTCRRGRPYASKSEYEQHIEAAKRREVEANEEYTG
jgi:hypothetical protein